MRIIAGKWKGAKLFASDARDLRPLTDRIKESLFGGIGERVESAQVLDLFAGSGSFGLEALSRGAAKATFVEKSPEVIRVLKKNIAKFACEHCEVMNIDVNKGVAYLEKTSKSFDILFGDPPFRKPMGQVLAELLSKHGPLIKKEGLVIIRHHKKEILNDGRTNFRLVRSQTYGDSVVDQFMVAL